MGASLRLLYASERFGNMLWLIFKQLVMMNKYFHHYGQYSKIWSLHLSQCFLVWILLNRKFCTGEKVDRFHYLTETPTSVSYLPSYFTENMQRRIRGILIKNNNFEISSQTSFQSILFIIIRSALPLPLYSHLAGRSINSDCFRWGPSILTGFYYGCLWEINICNDYAKLWPFLLRNCGKILHTGDIQISS